MPRAARIDAPGLLHHVMGRGIEKRKIFRNDRDRNFFLKRLGEQIITTKSICYAWCLMPTHFHLLLKMTLVPLATFMRRFMTSYAVNYNLWYKRSGHLFQNRYKSIVCEEDPYLLELVRYIHLNPIRSGLLSTLAELTNYPWCGHLVLLGRIKNSWQEVNEILNLFDGDIGQARKEYIKFIKDGLSNPLPIDLSGGGLARSIKRVESILGKSFCSRQSYDARILGSSDFVDSMLKLVKEEEEVKDKIRRKNITFEDLQKAVTEEYGIEIGEIVAKGRRRVISEARAVLSYLAVKYLGVSTMELSKILSLTQPAISVAYKRGECLCEKQPRLKDVIMK